MDFFTDAVKNNYANFNGRANRQQYWMFFLFSVIFSISISIIESIFGIRGETSGPLSAIYSLFIFVPSMAIAARRLHDTNKSGWWQLLLLVPIVGWVVLIVFLALEGDKGKNKYGEVSKSPVKTK